MFQCVLSYIFYTDEMFLVLNKNTDNTTNNTEQWFDIIKYIHQSRGVIILKICTFRVRSNATFIIVVCNVVREHTYEIIRDECLLCLLIIRRR